MCCCIGAQRLAGGDWLVSAGDCKRHVCAGARVAPGRDSHTDDGAGGSGSAGESCGAGAGLAATGADLCALEATRLVAAGDSHGAAAVVAGYCDADTDCRGVGYASDGSSQVRYSAEARGSRHGGYARNSDGNAVFASALDARLLRCRARLLRDFGRDPEPGRA